MTALVEPDLRSVMLLSIRPRFVEQILAGTKTIELRRSRPAVESGQAVAIYSTLPAGAIVAIARVVRVIEERTNEFWRDYRSYAGVSRIEYDEYFRGRDTAVGIELADVTPLDLPIGLEQMRRRGVANAPQQWHFLDRREWEDLPWETQTQATLPIRSVSHRAQ